MKVLNRRQAQWADYLSLFNFKIIYHPGRENGKADTLSCRVDLRLGRGSERQPVVQFLKLSQYVSTGEYVASFSSMTHNVLVLDREYLVALEVT